MVSISLHNQSDISYTQIPNIFIDEYMSQAHGAYVKVYLTLIRLLSRPDINLSIDMMAEILDLTENDIIRAISYWEKCSLLDVKRTNDGIIYDIGILNPVSEKIPSNINFLISYPDDSEKNASSVAAAAAVAEVSGEDEFKWLTGIIEQYMERPLSTMDIDLLVFLYDELNFSSDLILHLYEYCIERGKKNTRYIQKVAMNWSEKGVTTVVEANNLNASFDKKYMDIMKAFGLNTAPAPAQKKYIDSWYAQGFTSEIILEACNRTMISINEPNFKYTNGILENWHSLGLFTIEDIKKSDSVHAAKAQDKPHAKPSIKNNTFTSYNQRNYTKADYSSIEQQLLGKN